MGFILGIGKKHGHKGPGGKSGHKSYQRSRRTSRITRQRILRLSVAVVLAGTVAGGAATLWLNGAFARMGTAVSARAVSLSADAGFQVQDVLMTGRRHIDADLLRDTIGVQRGAPMLTLDIKGIHARLAAMPWVKEARVSRRLPATLQVDIVERKPLALWQHQKKLHLISYDGAVLQDDDLSLWRMLPLVVGEKANQEARGLFTLLSAEPVISGMTSSAVYVGQRRWDLHLKGGVTVRLPEKDAALALAHLARVETQKHLLGKDIKTVDLRQPDRLVILPNAPPEIADG